MNSAFQVRFPARDISHWAARYAYDGSDDAKPRVAIDSLRGESAARPYPAVGERRVLERTYHGRPDRHHAAALRLRAADGPRSCRRNVIRLVERQPGVERRVAG